MTGLVLLITLASCGKKESTEDSASVEGDILMLIVDYTTNNFEGGTELSFSEKSDAFTVTWDYDAPGDFGGIKLFYSEINEMLFSGTIIWMGRGTIEYPENILPAEHFVRTLVNNYIFPENGFEHVFFEGTTLDDEYNPVWASVQNVIKARKYLASNPSQKVKIFFYTPSVGSGNPADWKWILFLKSENFPLTGGSFPLTVTGIGHLPQVATCGYENQALRAAKK
jgi:hypothetical protein